MKHRTCPLRAALAADGAKYAQKLGQWIYYGKPIGDFGTEYTYRAMVAQTFLIPTDWRASTFPPSLPRIRQSFASAAA